MRTQLVEILNKCKQVKALAQQGGGGGGIVPSGTKNITANGIYDVTEFANANVDVDFYLVSASYISNANGSNIPLEFSGKNYNKFTSEIDISTNATQCNISLETEGGTVVATGIATPTNHFSFTNSAYAKLILKTSSSQTSATYKISVSTAEMYTN